jgi:hypothetical protein
MNIPFFWLQSRYERRPKKEGIFLSSWLPTGTYHKNPAIGNFLN